MGVPRKYAINAVESLTDDYPVVSYKKLSNSRAKAVVADLDNGKRSVNFAL